MPGSKLLARIVEISQKAQLENVAVAFYDYESSLRFSYHGDRPFHAASTFKAGILFALLKAAEAGKAQLNDPLHVRNRFLSIVDGTPYRIERDRDGDTAVHRRTGRSMSLEQLARAMITRSSNLATNLLLDFVGLPFIQEALETAGVEGLEIKRGVEDHVAFQQGINNEATAEGLLRLFRLFLDQGQLIEENRQRALEILFAQEFNSMIPARLPEGVRVAHKTGEISTHCHDAGIVYPPDRQPYVVAILTESAPSNTKRQKAVAEVSGSIYRYLVGGHKEEKQS
ncbi:serine hydrolase [Verrucomicrobiota bacterium sgz303538]